MLFSTHQVVVRFDAKQFSEVSEGQWSVSLQPEIWEVMCRSQVAAITRQKIKNNVLKEKKKKIKNLLCVCLYLGRKTVSTTEKSCMRTSLSGLELRFPTA